jgi:hypothetical protein
MKPDAICIVIGPSISRGGSICSALLSKLIFKKTINVFICIIVCSDTINKNFGNESYFKFSYGKFNYRGESPNATPNKDWWRWGRRMPQRHSYHLSQSARLIIICRLGTCVRSTKIRHECFIPGHFLYIKVMCPLVVTHFFVTQMPFFLGFNAQGACLVWQAWSISLTYMATVKITSGRGVKCLAMRNRRN